MTMTETRGPWRTCVGCRKVDRPTGLVRVVLSAEATAVVDSRRRLPGRGAWVHPARACLHNAAKGGLARSFRRAVDARGLLSQSGFEPQATPRVDGDSRDPQVRESTLASVSQKA